MVLQQGDCILVKNQNTPKENGIYKLTTEGDASNKATLTRVDQPQLANGTKVYVRNERQLYECTDPKDVAFKKIHSESAIAIHSDLYNFVNDDDEVIYTEKGTLLAISGLGTLDRIANGDKYKIRKINGCAPFIHLMKAAVPVGTDDVIVDVCVAVSDNDTCTLTFKNKDALLDVGDAFYEKLNDGDPVVFNNEDTFTTQQALATAKTDGVITHFPTHHRFLQTGKVYYVHKVFKATHAILLFVSEHDAKKKWSNFTEMRKQAIEKIYGKMKSDCTLTKVFESQLELQISDCPCGRLKVVTEGHLLARPKYANVAVAEQTYAMQKENIKQMEDTKRRLTQEYTEEMGRGKGNENEKEKKTVTDSSKKSDGNAEDLMTKNKRQRLEVLTVEEQEISKQIENYKQDKQELVSMLTNDFTAPLSAPLSAPIPGFPADSGKR